MQLKNFVQKIIKTFITVSLVLSSLGAFANQDFTDTSRGRCKRLAASVVGEVQSGVFPTAAFSARYGSSALYRDGLVDAILKIARHQIGGNGVVDEYEVELMCLDSLTTIDKAKRMM
jgi:hypothetical protein